MHFEWDQKKNAANIKKHKISFEEAQSVFYDEMGILIPDPEHSIGEERFILVGMADSLGICVVCHCYIDKTETIRFISVRKANRQEKEQYRGQYEK